MSNSRNSNKRPTTGESDSNKRVKPSYVLQERGPPDGTSTKSVGKRWMSDKSDDVRTRAEAREHEMLIQQAARSTGQSSRGNPANQERIDTVDSNTDDLDRQGEPCGDRSNVGLMGPITDFNNRPQDLDRLVQTSGDRSGSNLDRQDESCGDRFDNDSNIKYQDKEAEIKTDDEPEEEEEEIPSVESYQECEPEGSTPAIRTSDVSNEEVENILENEPKEQENEAGNQPPQNPPQETPQETPQVPQPEQPQASLPEQPQVLQLEQPQIPKSEPHQIPLPEPGQTPERQESPPKPPKEPRIPDEEGWWTVTRRPESRTGPDWKNTINLHNPLFFPQIPGLVQTGVDDANAVETVEPDKPKVVTPKKPGKAKKTSKKLPKATRDFLGPKGVDKPKGKERSGPPDWREYEGTNAIPVRKKFKKVDHWTEVDIEDQVNSIRKFDSAMLYPYNITREDAMKRLRDTPPNIRRPVEYNSGNEPDHSEEFSTDSESKSSLEYVTDDEVIRITTISARNSPHGDDQLDNDYYSAKRTEWGNHDETIFKLSKINQAKRVESSTNRPMSEVRLSYRHNPKMPNAMAGMTSMRILEEQDALKKECRSTSIAPSISVQKARNNGKERERIHKKTEISPIKEDEPGDRDIPPKEDRRHPGGPPSDGSDHGSGGSRRPRRPAGGRRSRPRRDRSESDSDGWDRNLKMKLPKPYDGKPDVEEFDSWSFGITNYAEVMKIRERTMIRMLAESLTGKAKIFYKQFVAGNADNWTYTTLFQAIFDYCFPKGIMKEYRIKWKNLIQGKTRVEEYSREIEILARRFKEMNERTVVLKFWDGLNAEIREIMITMRAEPEIDDLNEIVFTAMQAEATRDERNSYRKPRAEGDKKQPKREWTRFKNRTRGNKPYKPGEKEDKQTPNKSDKVRANAVSPQNPTEQKDKPNPRNKKLSRSKMDTLRAEGKCFNCQQTGHEQRNCPKLNSMKPPKPIIRTGAMSLANMDKLAKQKDEADIYFGHISIQEADPIAEDLSELEELEFRVHQMCEQVWGEDPLWYNEETRPDCRWSIAADDLEITVYDFENGGNRSFPRESIEDPNFSIADIFAAQEPIRTPRSNREGGYQLLAGETYQRWDWPAISWLQSRLSGQLEFVDEDNAPQGTSKENRIDVQPTMWGYSVQLDESDIIYNLTHEEVLDERFSPEWIIDQMLTARNVPEGNRGECFEDKRHTKYVSIMLGMTTVPGQTAKLKRRGNKKRKAEPEGVNSIERTSLKIKDKTRKLPEPIIIQASINGHTIRALLDTGSMADFLSTTVVDQLKLPKEVYQKPLSVQLVVHRSRSKINCGTTVNFQYQSIDCDRRFDIANLDNYDAILGTPFLYQHQVAIGFNPSRVVIGSSEPLEMKGPEVTTITSAAADLLNQGLDDVRKMLRQEAEDLCPDTSTTELPPFRDVNHTIPLIDERKKYKFRPSKCPEAFRDQWRRKKDAYLETGRWRSATGHNAIPLLMIPKISSGNGQSSIRTVFDK